MSPATPHPHYFTLDQTAVGDYRTFAKLSPPLRRPEDREALIDGLADGTIDAIASDHAPHDQDMQAPPFVQAARRHHRARDASALILALYQRGRLGLLEALAPHHLQARRHSRACRRTLAQRSARGSAALRSHGSWTIEDDRFRSKSKNSPFDERQVQGRVLRTIVDGRPGSFDGESRERL